MSLLAEVQTEDVQGARYCLDVAARELARGKYFYVTSMVVVDELLVGVEFAVSWCECRSDNLLFAVHSVSQTYDAGCV